MLSFLSRKKKNLSLQKFSLGLHPRKKLVRFPIIASSFTSCTRRPRNALYFFGADLFIRSFFRADFLCAVELTDQFFLFSYSINPQTALIKKCPTTKTRKRTSRGRAINHQHPRHRPTGEQLQATGKRRQRSDEDLEQRHLRVYRSAADTEPLEILLHLPLLAEDKNAVRFRAE